VVHLNEQALLLIPFGRGFAALCAYGHGRASPSEVGCLWSALASDPFASAITERPLYCAFETFGDRLEST
jgi:hypothetical protein